MKNEGLSYFFAVIFFLMFMHEGCQTDKVRNTLKEERVDRCEKEWKMPKQWCLGQAQIDRW